MRVETVKIKLYKYEELSEEAKEKVRQSFGEDHAQSETDFLEDDFVYQLEEKYPYFSDIKFQWSLSSCQGDGLSFSANIDIGKYLQKHYPKMKTSVHDTICNVIYNLHSNGNEGRYCYASKSNIDFDTDYSGRADFPRLEKLIENIIDDIRQEYLSICKDFEKQGYNAYENLYSDEYAKETCSSNEYEFTVDGKIY